MPRVSSHFGLNDPRFQSVLMPMIVPVNLTAAATLTPTQLLGGYIIVNAAAGVNLTLPTAASMCEAVQGAMVGTSFEFEVRAAGAGTATLVAAANTGVTLSGTATVATANTRTFLLNFTNVTIGQEAYTVLSRGTAPY